MKNSSEESDETSEEWNDKSEEFFRSSLGKEKTPPRKLDFLGGELLDGDTRSSSGASVFSPSSAPRKYYCSQRKSSNL